MIMTQPDRERLTSLLRMYNAGFAGNGRAQLLTKMSAARVVIPSAIPANVVTMNSIVRLIDIVSGEIITYALVYPAEANVDRLKISVLAPLGIALLGRTEKEVVEFTVPAGTKRYFIQEVLFQPEAQRGRAIAEHPDA